MYSQPHARLFKTVILHLSDFQYYFLHKKHKFDWEYLTVCNVKNVLECTNLRDGLSMKKAVSLTPARGAAKVPIQNMRYSSKRRSSSITKCKLVLGNLGFSVLAKIPVAISLEFNYSIVLSFHLDPYTLSSLQFK
jgi:hypothetical protein